LFRSRVQQALGEGKDIESDEGGKLFVEKQDVVIKAVETKLAKVDAFISEMDNIRGPLKEGDWIEIGDRFTSFFRELNAKSFGHLKALAEGEHGLRA
jgi:hypothetical protein